MFIIIIINIIISKKHVWPDFENTISLKSQFFTLPGSSSVFSVSVCVSSWERRLCLTWQQI